MYIGDMVCQLTNHLYDKMVQMKSLKNDIKG